MAEWAKEKERISVSSDGNLDVLSILNYDDEDEVDKGRENTIAPLFFLEKGLHQGSIMNLKFVKTATNYLLPRNISDSIPFFSKQQIQEIYTKFSVNSKEAETIKKIMGQCEKSVSKGEIKYCATSLESMIDYIISILGNNNIVAISTEPEKESDPLLLLLQKQGQQQKVEYAISGIKKVDNNGTAVVCHKLNYAYVVVFYCHKIQNTEAFKVSLVGADGTKTKAAAVCHKDTSEWNPKHLAFKVLKVKPGTVPVCHFLTQDNIIWVPNN